MLLTTLLLAMSQAVIHADLSQTNVFALVNKSIPDDDSGGMEDVRVIASDIFTITSLKIRLSISGNYNGDLYGYVQHSSGFTVLLNRPGRTTLNPSGYSDDGFEVVFADTAAKDIHNYRWVTTPPLGSPLSGTWQPDARFMDPDLVTSDSPRTAFLSSFNGLNADGSWTLFLADMESGGTNFLKSWALEITGKLKITGAVTWPTPASIVYGTALSAKQLNATSDVPGTFFYDPPVGTILGAGTQQLLAVRFVPNDTNAYRIATATIPLNVIPAQLVVAADPARRTYGQTNPVFTAILSGWVNGEGTDGLGGRLVLTTAADSQSPAGSYPIVPSGLAATNYAIAFSNSTLTVEAATLTVQAEDASRTYGAANPAWAATIRGFVNGETEGWVVTGSPSLTTDANSRSPVGSYVIRAGAGILSAPNYRFLFVEGTLAVRPAAITVSADDQSRFYGQTNPVFTASYTGFVNGEDSSILTGRLWGSTMAETNSPVGWYAIGLSGQSASNYSIGYVAGRLAIEPAHLLVAADNVRRVYGETNPVFTATLTGFVNGEDTNVVDGTLSLSTTADSQSPVGSYAIVPGGLVATNYSIAFSNGTLTVTLYALTVSANDAVRICGAANPSFTGNLTGLENGDNITVTFSTVATASSPVGTYAIGPSLHDPDGHLDQYAVIAHNGKLRIDPAPLLATAAAARRAYGQTNPIYTATYTGFVNGDDEAVVMGTLQGSSPAETNSPLGRYPIQVFGQSASNYAISYGEGVLTVEKAQLVVAADFVRREYGQTNPVFTATISGLANGEDTHVLDGTLVLTTAADSQSPVGSYPIVPGGLSAVNYSITCAYGFLAVEAATLTVKAEDASRTYGAANPAFTATIRGFVNGETEGWVVTGSPSLTTDANRRSPVGNYAIRAAEGSLGAANYRFKCGEGTLTVRPATLAATTDDLNRAYGQTNPVFVISYTGFVNGEDASLLAGQSGASTMAETNSPVGRYPIHLSGSASNYTIHYVDGVLTVTPARLVVAADNVRRAYGETNPVFTATLSGFVNGEDTQVLGGTLVLATTADSLSPAGSYAIVPSGLTATHYAIEFSNGTLAVAAYALTVSADNQARTYGAANPAFTGRLEGLQNGDTITATYDTVATPSSPVGTYAIVPLLYDPGEYLDKYAVITNTGKLRIDPAPLLVTADDVNLLYGQIHPAFTATLSGFVNGEDTQVLGGGLVLATAADSQSPLGSYAIVPSGLTATNYAISFSNGTLTIGKAAVLITVTSSANPAPPGSLVTFTAGVTAIPPGQGTPSGKVQFNVDGVAYGGLAPLVDGTVSLSTAALPHGQHTISVEYSGTKYFLGATNTLDPPQVINNPLVVAASVIQRVPGQGTKVAVTDLLANAADADGDTVALDSISATSAAGGMLNLSGGWIFYLPPPGFTNADSFHYTVKDGSGASSVGTVTINVIEDKRCQLTVLDLGNGSYRIVFSGSPWRSYAIQYTTTPASTNWHLLGTGTADYRGHLEYDDTPPAGTRLRFYRALSQAGGNPDSVSLLVLASANPASVGSLVSFSARLITADPGQGIPSGAVQFKVDGAPYGLPATLLDGSASLATAALLLGEYTIGAEYAGDANFLGATGVLDAPLVINSPPVAMADSIRRTPNQRTKVAVTDLLANDWDPDGDEVVFDSIAGTTAEGGTLSLADGWIFYTPPAGFLNNDSFTYRVRDRYGAWAMGEVAIDTAVKSDPSQNLLVTAVSNGTYRIVFSGVPWRTYTIQSTESLESPQWLFLGTVTADSMGQFEYYDTLPEGSPSRYYRSVYELAGPTASPFRFAVWTNFIAHTNGRTLEMWSERSLPPGWPSTPPVLAWNPDSLIYGLDGFTALSQCNEFQDSPGQMPVTLLTRRHGYMRGHGTGDNGLKTNLAGKKVWFCTASNTVVQMTIAANLTRYEFGSGNAYDYGLVIFTEDVPDSITPISVMSAVDFAIYYYYTPDIPFLFLGTEQLGHCAAGYGVPPFVYPLEKGGDSGSPNMIPLPGYKLVMYSGRSTSGPSPQMQADIDALSLYLGLNANNYRLRWQDMTPWAH